MKIDFTQKLMQINGSPIKLTDKPDAADATLQDIVTEALMAPNPAVDVFDVHSAGFKLASRISKRPTACELSREEVLTITRAVGRVYRSAGMCGPVDMLLDGGGA
jgi:hypothetical protein